MNRRSAPDRLCAVSAERLLEHFRARTGDGWVVLHWKKAAAEPVRVAVVRSEDDFAHRAEDVVKEGTGQILVHEGTDDSCQDQAVIDGVKYFYSAFARREDGFWERQYTFHIKAKVARVHKRTEFFGPDDSSYLRKMDRMRAGFAMGLNQPT